MPDSKKYKSVAIQTQFYDALVCMANDSHRGPGQEMSFLIVQEANKKGVEIKHEKPRKIQRRSK
tara:strand:- start:4091 stop:4282 length:192 start_codon:yes stop_codon:yes gene_type:complete